MADDARKVLKELELPEEFSIEAIAAIDAAANKLSDKAAKLKRDEAPRAERKAVQLKIARLVSARAYLHSLREAQPGDVVAGTGTAGS